MDCYVVLWIPTIVYNDFSASIKTSLEKNISDIPDRELIVKVDLLENGSFNVFIKSVEQYDLLVELKREQVSSNGLMMFSYKSTSNKESGFRFNSKYNTLCKIDGDDRGWRHKACNIENANYIIEAGFSAAKQLGNTRAASNCFKES